MIADPQSGDVTERGSELTTREFAPLVLTDPSAMQSESIRGLRTRLIAQHVREGRRALTLCTPSAGTGCTFVATNLAVAMAQIGIKTALIDADLRTPGVAAAFGLPEDQPGLSDCLAGDNDGIWTGVASDLTVMTAGRPASNPQELLSSERFPALVKQLLREFELTIFDTTPANRCTDAQRVATVVGYSMIVARKHKSFFSDVSTLAKMLRADRSKIVGTILNEY